MLTVAEDYMLLYIDMCTLFEQLVRLLQYSLHQLLTVGQELLNEIKLGETEQLC